MNIIKWLFQTLLILAFALFGIQKVFMPLPDLIAQGMLWIEDFQSWQIRTIGLIEAIGALGLFLPYIIKSIPKVWVSFSAAGLALTMTGAIITHIARGDVMLSIIITSALCLMAAFTAFSRFKEYHL